MFILPSLDITFSKESAQDRTVSSGILQITQNSFFDNSIQTNIAQKKQKKPARNFSRTFDL